LDKNSVKGISLKEYNHKSSQGLIRLLHRWSEK